MGNSTNSYRETSHLVELNEEYSRQTEEYKRLAEKRRSNMSYSQEDMTDIYDKMWAYIEGSETITISGCILAMGVHPRAFNRMKNGEYNYRLEQYCAENDISQAEWLTDKRGVPYILDSKGNRVLMIDYEDMVEMFLLMYQNQAEQQVASGKPVGGIFTLKSQFQWNDKVEEQPRVDNHLVIADAEQARKVLEMLK